ncbi:MAG: flagellar motor switch protein FliN [Desulfosarcinaceae bacterium]|nr:flagellar motor switch protein FliN [Desulfosarcinaceae bacterium]
MQKFTDDQIRASVSDTLTETFDTMLSMQLSAVDSVEDPGLDEDRMVGAVNFAGEVVGTMSLHVSRPFSNMLTAAMLGMGPDEEIDEETVRDVVGELTNILTGNLKTEFVDAGLSCVISTPHITTGSDFKIDPLDIAPPLKYFFRHEPHDIFIELVVKEESGGAEAVGAVSDLSTDEVISMINSVDIRATVVNAVIDVFFTMLEMEIDHIQEVPAAFAEELRTVGTVTFAGDVDGLFNIQVNDDFGQIMTAAMLGMAPEEVESAEDIYDVIREMSNIIGGNLKSAFVDAGLACVLSTPSITNGLDFRVEAATGIHPERFLFAYNDHTIIVEAGIKKEQAAAEADADAAQSAASRPEATAAVVDELQNLDFIMEIPMEVTVELGRTRKKINDLLRIQNGSVVALQQLDGEPVDILVNKTLIARGEVVVEKEKYGIRITEIVSRRERLNSLR